MSPPNYDGRYPLLNHAYLHYGVETITVATTAVVDTPAGVLLVDNVAPINVTLPAAVGRKGYAVYVKKVSAGGAGAVTIARSGADLIDGATSQSLAAQYDGMLLVSDGVSGWWVLAIGP